MQFMQSMRTNAAWLRLALAGLFAVASLVQVPAMAFARTSGPAHHTMASVLHADHEISHSTHHHHTQSDLDVDRSAAPICCVVGCCLAIGAVSIAAPAALLLLLGKIEAAPPRAMVAVLPDPADPPPRLQA